jgi:hypothetical protein
LVILFLALGACIAARSHFSQPQVLTIAVGPANGDDADFVDAWSRTLASEGSHIRLDVLMTSGRVESREKLRACYRRLWVS